MKRHVYVANLLLHESEQAEWLQAFYFLFAGL